ncbi:ABC transporter ATP-binding protein [bacterium]|nr:ABC transporter ATP-binding protein [bacterium]
MGHVSQFKKALDAELKSQKDAKAARKAEKAKIPFKTRLWEFVKRWAARLFHTFFMAIIIYIIVLASTSFIPFAMGYIIGGLGYSINSTVDMLLAFLSGLFFTAWIFVGTFVAVKYAGKIYIRNMKKTFSPDILARIAELK